jgi:hypothetical protein
MTYDIFVSYRRSDRELVAKVVERLEQRGVSTWYDAEIEGGADWRETIVEALTNSGLLVIFFSEQCNSSRQLKKELAVADSLAKAVVPILIEDTQPKGAYLYELADRNWIQAWPDPASKIDELVEHLVALVGKPFEAEASAAPRMAAANDEVALASAAPAATPAGPAANDDLFAPPPRLSDAYVGKVSEQRRKKPTPTRDILPFKWIDLLFLAPMVGGLAWLLKSSKTFASDGGNALYEPTSIGLLGLALVGFYGALVFPVRYYMRRRPIGTAFVKYLMSSVVLYGLALGGFTLAWSQGMYPHDTPAAVAALFGEMWGVFTAIAFVIYGVLSGQRALRSFRSNIKKI